MRLEEVMPALRSGKRVRRKSWGEGCFISASVIDNLGSASIFAEDWEIVEEPKPPKLLAPAILHQIGSKYCQMSLYLFESEEEAKGCYGKAFVKWPVIPNKDGYFEVPV